MGKNESLLVEHILGVFRWWCLGSGLQLSIGLIFSHCCAGGDFGRAHGYCLFCSSMAETEIFPVSDAFA